MVKDQQIMQDGTLCRIFLHIDNIFVSFTNRKVWYSNYDIFPFYQMVDVPKLIHNGDHVWSNNCSVPGTGSMDL